MFLHIHLEIHTHKKAPDIWHSKKVETTQKFTGKNIDDEIII